jgi:hypothetical protein
MTHTAFTTNASRIIETAGSTAHSAIGAWRDGGERMAELAATQWDKSFRQASPRLSPETRRNAGRAQKAFGRAYRRGLQLSTAGAVVAVDAAVRAAGTAVERAAEYARAGGGRPG